MKQIRVLRRLLGGASRTALLASLLFALILPSPARAAPGDLDPTFGSGGKVVTGFGFASGAQALVVQRDGKLVVAGFSDSRFGLVRYNADGGLDATFGSGGKVTTDFGATASASAVVLQADGKIVVAGRAATAFGTFEHFALARYLPDGTLDATFGIGGKVITDFGGPSGASALALQADGKIVVAGTRFGGFCPSPVLDFAVARYLPNGQLDASFGSQGKVTTDFGGTCDVASALAVQPDGKIVVAGTHHLSGSTSSDFALARYNPDGSLDATFGDGGKVTTHFSGAFDSGSGVAVQADGKIVAAGYSGSNDFALARYNPNGTLDVTFGDGGRVLTDFGGFEVGRALVLQGDGKSIVAGTSFASGQNDFVLARYNPDGSLDSTFGGGGKVRADFGADDQAFAVALQPDGKIVVAGTNNPQALPRFALARYRGDPTLYLRLAPNQTTFGPGGLLELDVAEANSGPDALVDRYLGAVLPPGVGPALGCPANDTVAFVTETLGLLLTCLSAPPQTFPPFVRNVLIPADLPLTFTNDVFQTMWPMGAPGGTYILFMADVRSGAVADGSLDPGDVLVLGTAAVSFTQ